MIALTINIVLSIFNAGLWMMYDFSPNLWVSGFCAGMATSLIILRLIK